MNRLFKAHPPTFKRFCKRGNLATFVVVALSGCSSYPAYAKDDTPPEFKPYKLPLYKGNESAVSDKMPAYIQAKIINADDIYYSALNCYPNASKWKLSVDLKAGVSSDSITSDEGSSLGKNYVGIVAKMPLFSSKDLDRAIKNERDLRESTAESVAKFVKSIADRNNAVRKVDLYSSLEARSSVRVQRGIVEAKEQVG
ncbi:MAG: hypothetical protein V3U75_13625, partial [Methylococcaceae bacterium]